MPMTDKEEERITLLEERLAYYDGVVSRLIQFARLTPKGQAILAILGLR